MAQYDSTDDIGSESSSKKQLSVAGALFTVISMLVADIFIYTIIISLIGTYIAGTLCRMNDLSASTELVLTVVTTFILLYLTFCLIGEASYWKHLFEFEKFYCTLLQIRDVTNTAIFLILLYCMASTVQSMVVDKAMKDVYVGEGAFYVFAKTIVNWFNMDEGWLEMLGLELPRKGTMVDPNFGENERYEHGGSYMLFWAMMAACIGKLLYFNTLFTYLRAMEIFISLRPSFDDDDVDSMESASSILRRVQSQLTRMDST